MSRSRSQSRSRSRCRQPLLTIHEAGAAGWSTVAPRSDKLPFVIGFTPLCLDHLPLMHTWWNEPHMLVWWSRGKVYGLDQLVEKYGPQIRGEEPISGFVIELDASPIGYIQHYPVTYSLPEGVIDASSSPLLAAYRRDELAGVDAFIGDPAYLGRGHGSAATRALVDQYVHPRFRAAVIDPGCKNERAMRAYEKAGFQRTDFSQDAEYVLLIRDRER
jgi:aminoglycoside 6'-N-acetyltransferase